MNDNKVKQLVELFLNQAFTLLVRRPQSEYEMRFKLARFGSNKNIPELPSIINQVVEFLENKNYLNDKDFAKWLADQRFEFKQMSKRKLKFELQTKGISQILIESTLENYEEDLACKTLAHKKRHMNKEKLKQYLYRQGFNWGMIEDACDKLLGRY